MKPILLIIVIVGGISTLVYLIAREFINYLTKFQYRLLNYLTKQYEVKE